MAVMTEVHCNTWTLKKFKRSVFASVVSLLEINRLRIKDKDSRGMKNCAVFM